ncbi:phosphoribosylamine--glycine ligase [Propioniciclava tarda]|uniref:Phosphoribosylamine--glycine ligase n=1 Tax=Propioniciclava tarda TaxID=433330 RepID=A0A4Q9KL90_PROTD|nr:phosphoribosylamine--glycine ligase [Propioniciclava tarda]TBT94975.1 phosphoribosylamine--glycine ligase [Propioniciclava tarda]
MTELVVLVLGGGGREHALALALSRDPSVVALHCAPGNPGTASIATNHALDPCDGAAVLALATSLGVNLVVVGPEAPLVAGVTDAVRAAGIACFGPSAEAARLEGSKQFAKEVMVAAGVPTAASVYCTTVAEVAEAIDRFGPPYVVKQDGLAAGKGVIVTSDRDAALAHAADALPAVVEEFLDGPEASLFVVTDGRDVFPFPPAQDFKRVGEGDAGPNTGGMGAYTPLDWTPRGLIGDVVTSVVVPTLAEMDRRGTPFAGLLYVGLALTSRGPRVVEFNVRFGDPETQVVLPRLSFGLGGLLYAAASGTLGDYLTTTDRFGFTGYAVGVVVAADGYPGTPASGGRIAGPRLFGSDDNVHIIHAGTSLDADGNLVASGGRVLTIVATGDTLDDCRRDAYAAIDELHFPSGFCRRDIALRAAQGEIETPSR